MERHTKRTLSSSISFALWLSVPISLLTTPVLSFATPAIDRGTSQHQVLVLLGSPEEKIELEVKRESIWRYKDGQVVHFKDGVSIPSPQAKATESVEKAPVKVETSHVAKNNYERGREKNERLPFSGTEIFSEIAKIESSTDSNDKKPVRTIICMGYRYG